MVHYSDDGYLLCNACANGAAVEFDDHAHKHEGFHDQQRKCAGCGLDVDAQTGRHIDLDFPQEN